MISQDEDGRTVVVFDQINASSRKFQRIALSLDVYLFLVAESRDIEQLRCMIFEYANHETKREKIHRTIRERACPQTPPA